MIKEGPQAGQNATRLGYQFFVMDFNVILGDLASVIPAFLHHPFPVQRGLQQSTCFWAPREGAESFHLHERQGNVTSVPENVYEQRIRQVPLDSSYMQDIVRVINCPSLCGLVLGD